MTSSVSPGQCVAWCRVPARPLGVWPRRRPRATRNGCSVPADQRSFFTPLEEYSCQILHGSPLENWSLCGERCSGSRPPVSFLQATATAELVEYLLEGGDGPFSGGTDSWPTWFSAGPPVETASSGRWESWGFEGSPKEPFLLKADWHCVPQWGTRHEAFVPRLGSCASIRRAPLRVTAFMEAFRQVNAACWQAFEDELEHLHSGPSKSRRTSSGCPPSTKFEEEEEEDDEKEQEPGDEDIKWFSGFLLEVLRSGGLFGSIEAQVGPAVGWHQMRSHTDGTTGLLHLGLTLQGRRVLQLGLHDSPQLPDNANSNNNDNNTNNNSNNNNSNSNSNRRRDPSVWDSEAWHNFAGAHLVQVPMERGSAYLSSPFLFEHGVTYLPGGFVGQGSTNNNNNTNNDNTNPGSGEPTLLLMCRLAFPAGSGALRANQTRGPGALAVAKALASCLAAGAENGNNNNSSSNNNNNNKNSNNRLRLPSLGEVQEVQKILS
ncbi:unnamed protein product [Polarella glacialis]|uniref:Uncharacterized protein n=1 Tax=Polarella glacialis TaxID=89957 RepID=A0A813DXA4_POLGL|nr:unnamed protein product [Polarella glacialis]